MDLPGDAPADRRAGLRPGRAPAPPGRGARRPRPAARSASADATRDAFFLDHTTLIRTLARAASGSACSASRSSRPRSSPGRSSRSARPSPRRSSAASTTRCCRANPRSRKVYDEPKWTGYEVVLDVFPDVFAYGILLVPKDIKPGERRPVVVCQHGLEGRAARTSIEGDSPAYHDFAARLAERGFITFAPQNLYSGEDRFRMLSRKANPLKLSLFSFIVAQHRADPRLAGDAAVRRRRADRLLRPQLRRQDGHARAAAARRLLPVDLLGRLQRLGAEDRLDRQRLQLHVHRSSGRCPTSTWATRSTTPRWPP